MVTINPKVYFVTKSHLETRRIAIADIHGCAKTLQKLLDLIQPTEKDQLFFLGDYLHKGPDSASVLDCILNLKEQNLQIYPLSGNHEQMALQKYYKRQKEIQNNIFTSYPTLPSLFKKANFADENGIIYTKYLDFLEKLPFCYETEDCFFVHAGLNLEAFNPLEDFYAMLHQRENQKYEDYLYPEKRIIHGHEITTFKQIEENILIKKDFIGIDNGCFYGVKKEGDTYLNRYYGDYGGLCALDIDNWKLYVQKCID